MSVPRSHRAARAQRHGDWSNPVCLWRRLCLGVVAPYFSRLARWSVGRPAHVTRVLRPRRRGQANRRDTCTARPREAVVAQRSIAATIEAWAGAPRPEFPISGSDSREEQRCESHAEGETGDPERPLIATSFLPRAARNCLEAWEIAAPLARGRAQPDRARGGDDLTGSGLTMAAGHAGGRCGWRPSSRFFPDAKLDEHVHRRFRTLAIMLVHLACHLRFGTA